MARFLGAGRRQLLNPYQRIGAKILASEKVIKLIKGVSWDRWKNMRHQQWVFVNIGLQDWNSLNVLWDLKSTWIFTAALIQWKQIGQGTSEILQKDEAGWGRMRPSSGFQEFDRIWLIARSQQGIFLLFPGRNTPEILLKYSYNHLSQCWD